MAKLRFDPLTYQFYYQCRPEEGLAQTLRVLIGTRSDAGTTPRIPTWPWFRELRRQLCHGALSGRSRRRRGARLPAGAGRSRNGGRDFERLELALKGSMRHRADLEFARAEKGELPMNHSLLARPFKRMAISSRLLLAVGMSAVSAALPVNPQDSVRSLYDTLLATMKDGRTLGQSGRYARLAPVVGRLFDIPLMARLAVGPSWAGLNQAQVREARKLRALHLGDLCRPVRQLLGEQLQVTGEQPAPTESWCKPRSLKRKAIR